LIKRLIKLHPDKLVQTHLPKMAEFFVAVVDKRIIGCCALEVYSKRLAEIRSLSVEKEFQGQGIASALVEKCLKLAEKKKILEVLAITSADGLFYKHGFGTFNKEKFALLKFMK